MIVSFLRSLPRLWRKPIVAWIVSLPLFCWLGMEAIYDRQFTVRQAIAVFWIYLFISYFIVNAILRKLDKGSQ
jgi:hypothetical protein